MTPACPAPSPTSGNATIASRAATSTRTIVTPVDGACVASHVTVTSRSQADDRMSSQPTWARLEAVFAVQHVIAQFGSAVHSRRGPQRLPSGRRSAGFRQSRVGPRGPGVVPIVRCMSDCSSLRTKLQRSVVRVQAALLRWQSVTALQPKMLARLPAGPQLQAAWQEEGGLGPASCAWRALQQVVLAAMHLQ